MEEDGLKLYRALSRAPFPRSYLGKVFFAAFLGTHVPLLALLAYLVRYRRFGLRGALRILAVTVPATLGGTSMTLWAIHALYAPVTLASKALRRYLESGDLPGLPVIYTDRAGRLMADVQHAIERLDAAIGALGEQASRDHLTGTYNRRAAEERLSEDLARAERGGGKLTLVFLDLDHLKRVNDGHGHRAGDACLVHFAEALEGALRAGDWFGRWGGDEFLAIVWHTEGEERSAGPSAEPSVEPTAERALERIVADVREDLRENPVVLAGGEEVTLTFSGGACRWRRGDH